MYVVLCSEAGLPRYASYKKLAVSIVTMVGVTDLCAGSLSLLLLTVLFPPARMVSAVLSTGGAGHYSGVELVLE